MQIFVGISDMFPRCGCAPGMVVLLVQRVYPVDVPFSKIDFIVRKDPALLDELWQLNQEENLEDFPYSVDGSIELYEDFLAGNATWRRKLPEEALAQIRTNNPLTEGAVADWLKERLERYPALVIYLQQLQDLKKFLLLSADDL